MRNFMLLAAAAYFSASVPAEPPRDYVQGRSPGEITLEQHREMMSIANDYNVCVYAEAIARLDAAADIRQIADTAMGSCQSHLDKLVDTIKQWGYPEYFADRFSRNVRNRSARKLLPELAIRKSR